MCAVALMEWFGLQILWAFVLYGMGVTNYTISMMSLFVISFTMFSIFLAVYLKGRSNQKTQQYREYSSQLPTQPKTGYPSSGCVKDINEATMTPEKPEKESREERSMRNIEEKRLKTIRKIAEIKSEQAQQKPLPPLTTTKTVMSNDGDEDFDEEKAEMRMKVAKFRNVIKRLENGELEVADEDLEAFGLKFTPKKIDRNKKLDKKITEEDMRILNEKFREDS